MIKSRIGIVILGLLLLADMFLWWEIFGAGGPRPGDYFLNVGQGDSELVVLPNGVRILTDAGPDASVVREVEKILPVGDRYIDIAVITHPQADHYNGYNYLLDSVSVGAFVWNGRDDDPSVASWKTLLAKIKAKNIPMIVLGRGDTIVAGDSKDNILSPDSELASSAELNDTGLVEFVKTPSLKTLMMADTGMNVEQFLLQNGSPFQLVGSSPCEGGAGGGLTENARKYQDQIPMAKEVPSVQAFQISNKNPSQAPHPDAMRMWRVSSPSQGRCQTPPNLPFAGEEPLRADVLKVGHHGSKYATSDAFLRAVNPSVAAIEVGAHNTYGHPASSTLARIASSTRATVFRTDQNGTIFLESENGKLKVESEK